MDKGSIGNWWMPRGGQWEQKCGFVEGAGEDSANLEFSKSIPENFRISFDAQLSSFHGHKPSTLAVFLMDEQTSKEYCALVLGRYDNSAGEVRRSGSIVQIICRAVVKPEIWQAVSIELRDDTIVLRLDGDEMFRFCDPFPPAYVRRSKIALGTWRSMIRIRNFVVQDLGFLPFTRTVRQGDSLYNAGLFEQAFQFYSRLLQSEITRGNESELRYKIGMCLLGLGNCIEAKTWMDDVPLLSQTDLWTQYSQIALLEIEWREDRHESFCEKAKQLLDAPALCDRVWDLVQQACRAWEMRGFYEISLHVRMGLLSRAQTDLIRLRERTAVAETLLSLNRLALAERYFEEAASQTSHFPQHSRYSLFALATVRNYLGALAKARQTIGQIKQRTWAQDDLAGCEIHEALFLRAEARFAEALTLLRGIPERFPMHSGPKFFAALTSSLILCGQERMQEAKRELEPWYSEMTNGAMSRFLYPPLFLEGNIDGAIQCLTEGFRQSGGEVALFAEQGIKAGILLWIHDRTQEAGDIWAEVVRRFPPGQCCCFPALARQLLDGDDTGIEQLTYSARIRSELFYLLALWNEKRGKSERALVLFAMSAKEDPTNEWPAVLAKKHLTSASVS